MDSKTSALEEARRLEQEGKRTGRAVDRRAGRITVNEWFTQWMDSLHVSEKTASSYRDRHAVVSARWGSTPIQSIDRAEYARWLRDMTGPSGKKLSATRRNDCAKQLVRMLDAAVSANVLYVNPLRDAAGKLPSMPTRRREREHRYLTAQELQRLATSAAEMDRRLGREFQSEAIVLVLGWGGLRWGELTALTVADFDADRGTLRVSKAYSDVGGRLVLGAPKTAGSRRTVLLPRFVVEKIERMLRRRGEVEPNSLLFHGGRGAPMRTTGWPRRVLAPALDHAGIEPLTPHDLRHTCASLSIASGATVKDVQRQLGHEHASLTLDTYGHLLERSDLADRLDVMAREAAGR